MEKAKIRKARKLISLEDLTGIVSMERHDILQQMAKDAREAKGYDIFQRMAREKRLAKPV